MYVREFHEEDRDTFLKLCSEFYNANATLRPYDERLSHMTFDRVLDHHENLWGFMMFDKETNEAIGYSLITSYWCNEEGGNVLVLDELYISPVDRHRGYASKFMEWLQQRYAKRAVAITLEVLSTNQSAKSLYAKEGFAPDGFVTYTKRIPIEI